MELSDTFGGQVKLPYSTGLIWSHCLLNKEIKDNFRLSGWFYKREEDSKIIKQIKNPDIVAFSNFVWNTKINHRVAKTIKELYPNCLIIFGGLGNPNKKNVKAYLKQHDYIDLIVNGEGEITFEHILSSYLHGRSYEEISGLSSKNFITKDRDRIKDIDTMPSPYLDGLFDKLVMKSEDTFEGVIESTRGCPYQCTFCEIGDLYFQKMSMQSNEKVFRELDWLSKNKIDFFYNADSNFGLLKNHGEIVDYMSQLKMDTGYPANMMVDWAKSKADKVVDLAQKLTDANLLKGITIALQSMNVDALKAIKRKNVDNNKLQDFINLYKDKNLKSYIELILGLPKESTQSFKDGIYKILDMGFTDYVNINVMTALPNTPFFDESYIKEYGIKIVETTPAFFHHENAEDLIDEKEMMVVGSETMSIDDYIEASLFKWYISFCEYLGTTNIVANLLNKIYDIKKSDFYDRYYNYIKANDSFLNDEYKITKKSLQKILKKEQCWGRKVEDKTYDIHWEFQEATAINLLENKKSFYDNLKEFISNNYKVDTNVLNNIIEFQIYKVSSPDITYPFTKKFDYNLEQVLSGKQLKNGGHEYMFSHKNFDDVTTWAKEILWWGRKNKSYEVTIVDL